jgi:ATP-dependent DNA helicase PIF1
LSTCKPTGWNVGIQDERLTAQHSLLQKYQDRIRDAKEELREGLQDISLFQWIRDYNWKTYVVRPRAIPRIINYWPRYSNDPELSSYNDYCRVRLILHHPFIDITELLEFDGHSYDSYTDAFQACSLSHTHPEDYYTDPKESNEDREAVESDPESDTDIEDDLTVPVDFEALSRRNPNRDLTVLIDNEAFASRPLDRLYDWNQHVGTLDIQSSILADLKAANPIDQTVEVDSSPSTLNSAQSQLYSLVIRQYSDILDLPTPIPQQLLLHVDVEAGSGKTYTLLKIWSWLQELANQAGKSNPVLRAAPTGIAAFNIIGKTLHSLFKLPIKKKTSSELSTGTLQALQATFAGCFLTFFLIIDEKSMIGLDILSLVDERLRAAKPTFSYLPFGGINILLCGDFFQLPPVTGTPLFSTSAISLNSKRGLELYRAFDRTVRLTELMRQNGIDNESVLFRTALKELRESKLSKSSWELLCTRVQNQLSNTEVSQFNNAIRLYYTLNEVTTCNRDRLMAWNNPILSITACNQGCKADKAPSDQADGLENTLSICIGARVMMISNIWTEIGLVNGTLGTVTDISWAVGSNPSVDIPFVILMKVDSCNGPQFPGLDSGVVPIFTAQRKFEYKGVDCERTQFPLKLAYAITVHKSQGLTLPRVILNLAQKEHSLGLAYVAVSRVKTLKSLLFESPFDFDHFAHSETKTQRDRTTDMVFRILQLIQ